MHTTQARVSLAYQHAMVLKHQQQNSCITGLRILCYALFALDLSALIYLCNPQRYHTPEHWLYGSTLLPSNAGGYVLVAVVTFVVATTITIVCIKQHEKAKQQEETI